MKKAVKSHRRIMDSTVSSQAPIARKTGDTLTSKQGVVQRQLPVILFLFSDGIILQVLHTEFHPPDYSDPEQATYGYC